MLKTIESGELLANRLLATLSEKQLQRLTERDQLVELNFGDYLHEPRETICDVYFPMSGVVSVFAVEDQKTFEVGMIGSEGVAGLPIASGTIVSPYLTVVQGKGVALKISAADFIKESEQNKIFARALNRSGYFLQVQILQAVICNRLHLIESRLACLLLLMQDRLKTDQFQLKQEFLAKMLGFRRQAVTTAAGRLQQQKIISYSRGNLLILDRANLEKICCRCYQIVTDEYQSLLAIKS